MKRLFLTACILFISAPFALAQTHYKHGGHAPEMTDIGMALAGLTSLAGYLAIRRRATRKK